MQQRSFFLLVVLLCIILQCTFPIVAADLLQLPSTPRLASGPPLVKTNWVILNSNATTDGYSYPRVASFKSGTYAIIFGYSAANYTSVTQVRLVNATNGAIYSVSEAEYSTVAEVGPLLGPMTAQNLVIFPDDNALAIWQMKGLAKCVGFSFTEDYFLPSTNIIYQDIGVWNATDYLDIAGSSWSHYAIGYSGDTDVSNFLYKNPDVTTQVLPSSFGSGTAIHSAVTRKLYSGYPTIFTFIVYSSQGGYFTLQSLNVGATTNYDDTIINATKAIPFVLEDLDIVAGLFVTSDGRIQLVAFDTIAVSALYQINVTRYADSNFSPSVLQLSNNVVLVAFSSAYNRINYQMVKLSRTTAVLVGPEVTHDAPSTTMSVSMASTIGSDIIVVAKDVTGTQIMSRTITFCGNGALDLKEECDGSLGCTDQCKCQFGTVAVNGTCVDQCQNGIVTGYEDCDSGTGCVDCKCAPGYKPMSPRSQGCQLIPKEFVPNVKPQFDCLETTTAGLLLHFSFINNDGFDETIEYGGLNSFTPTTLGKDRPTMFVAGQSLTYPVSPYSTEVTNDTRSITWILSSYNLTVDLTKPSLECPKSLSVDLTLSTFGNLTDALVQKLLQNIASKYNISESRLSAEYTLVSTNSQGLNTYLIIVTVNASTSSEESSVNVVKDLLDDIQKSKDEFDSDLTEGLEEVNPVIKSVTPSIIESRGTSTPISVFTPTDTPGTEQMSGSSAVCIQLAVIYSLMIASLTVL